MNEHDYTLLEYVSLLSGFALIGSWNAFMLIYGMPYTMTVYVGLLLIGIFSFALSITAYFKKKIFILEMEKEILNHRNDENGKMGSDSVSKF